MPAVVNIAVTETCRAATSWRNCRRSCAARRSSGSSASASATGASRCWAPGSGFIIDPSGIIVTNNHVVGHADQIVVSLSDGTRAAGPGDRHRRADRHRRDPGRRPTPAARPCSWGDSRKVEVGDWILAAGNPFGLGISVTAGIVSARGRDIGAGPFDDFLQIDAPINPGNSGGPTFNMDGQVIGVNTAIVSPTGGSVGIGFAIPSEIAQPIVERLRNGGHIERGWLGVSVQDRPGAAEQRGDRSPASTATARRRAPGCGRATWSRRSTATRSTRRAA